MTDLEAVAPLCEEVQLCLGEMHTKLTDMKTTTRLGGDTNVARKEISKLISDIEKLFVRLESDLISAPDSEEKHGFQKQFKKANTILNKYKTEFQNLKDGK